MPNKLYQATETAITWRASGGTRVFTPTSLAAGSGRQGEYHDLGTSSRARRFRWRAFLKPGATRVVNELIQIYLTTGDGTHYDNDDGTGDIAVSNVNKLRNVQRIGTIAIDEDAAVDMNDHGDIEISEQYVAPIFWNATANALSSTAADFGFDLVPVPDEVQ